MKFTREDTRIMKGIAILLMLTHHLFAFPKRLAEGVGYHSLIMFDGQPLAFTAAAMGKICVALFIFLGGYGTYLSAKGRDMNRFIPQKLQKLYLPYWKVFCVTVPISFILGTERIVSQRPRIGELIWNFTGLKFSYNGEWGFFVYYVILILMFPLIRRILDRKHAVVTFDLFMVVVLNMFLRHMLPRIMDLHIFSKAADSLLWSQINPTLDYLAVWIMGCICAKYDLLSRLKRKFVGNYCFTLLGFVMVCAVFYMRYKYGNKYDYIYAPLLTFGATVFLACPQARLLRIFFDKIGQRSTFIWLTHTFFCYHWCQKLIYMPKYPVLIVAWLLLISYLAAIALEIFYQYLGRFYEQIKKHLKYEIKE